MSVRQNGVIIAGSGSGSVDVDNSTITTNAMDEIQAVATINANTAAGATNPVYDWIGTLAEHQAQNIETLHPDWICYITDDINGGTSVYTKSEIDTLLTGKVNTALSNLTTAGKGVIANLAMPSNYSTALTLGVSGASYYAPADGYVYICKVAQEAPREVIIENDAGMASMAMSAVAGNWLRVCLPVRKGSTFTVTYDITGTTVAFKFIYAEGRK